MIIFVYDFDDTLFATSYFTENPSTKSTLLGKSISSLLSTSSKYGKVYIITNATHDWPEFAIRLHLTDSHDVLDNVSIVSTHSGFNNGDMSTWKMNAFNETLKVHFQDGKRHQLISFGDNPFDHSAAVSIRENFPNVTVKSILMGMRPSLTQLLHQHFLLFGKIEYIVDAEDHLDLVMIKPEVRLSDCECEKDHTNLSSTKQNSSSSSSVTVIG